MSTVDVYLFISSIIVITVQCIEKCYYNCVLLRVTIAMNMIIHTRIEDVCKTSTNEHFYRCKKLEIQKKIGNFIYFEIYYEQD